MKEEPAFKAPQGNPAIFHVISSRGPFLLRQKMQGASHITISEGILFLMCLWKVSLPLQLKTENHEQFCIPGVTSVFFSSCDSVVGDSLEFNQANRGSLRV